MTDRGTFGLGESFLVPVQKSALSYIVSLFIINPICVLHYEKKC